MNVKTGEILAMASYPDYEPSLFYNGISQAKFDEYRNNPYHPLYSKAFQSTYAPGSTYKMVTAIAALETGKVTKTEKINDSGPYYGLVSGNDNVSDPACWYYNDYGRGHGPLNIVQAIQKSCNYFFFDVGLRIGGEDLAKYAKYFGLGSKTGVEIVGEGKGDVAQKSVAESKKETWSKAQLAYASIGQGFNNFTPLQIAKYISMLANGGKKLDVTIIKSINRSNGTQVSRDEINQFVNKKLGLKDEEEEDIQISQDSINIVHEGMLAVTEGEGGTASSSFKNFPIQVGGKTGSAEFGTGKNARTDGWFVGFAPYDNPEIAVVVVIENAFHGYYTAETVKQIIYEYFGMNIEEVIEDMSAYTETESFR